MIKERAEEIMRKESKEILVRVKEGKRQNANKRKEKKTKK